MNLRNARQAIHDAFADSSNLDGTLNIKKTSGKNLGRLGHQVVAGLVIKAVYNQPAHLRAVAMFLNGPETAVTMNDSIAMKTALWSTFIKKNQVTPYDQGIIISHIDRILIGYRGRVWNNESRLHTLGDMFRDYTPATQERLTGHANQLLDVLMTYDGKSLAPVWELIDGDREVRQSA